MKAPLIFNSAEFTDHNNNRYIFVIYARNCLHKNKIIQFDQTALRISILKKWTFRSFNIYLQSMGVTGSMKSQKVS